MLPGATTISRKETRARWQESQSDLGGGDLELGFLL